MHLFFVIVSPSSPINIAIANGSSMSVQSIGFSSFPHLSISYVFYVPHLSVSLISISHLSVSGFESFFSSSHCVFLMYIKSLTVFLSDFHIWAYIDDISVVGPFASILTSVSVFSSALTSIVTCSQCGKI